MSSLAEALRKLSDLDKEIIADIRWYKRIIAFRNILIHQYTDVDDQLVWETLEAYLPALASDVKVLLENDWTLGCSEDNGPGEPARPRSGVVGLRVGAVRHPPALQGSHQVGRGPFRHPDPGADGGAPDVRDDEAVGKGYQGMICRDGFGICHVQAGGGDLPPGERLD